MVGFVREPHKASINKCIAGLCIENIFDNSGFTIHLLDHLLERLRTSYIHIHHTNIHMHVVSGIRIFGLYMYLLQTI